MEDNKVLFKAKCIDNKDTDYETGEIYNYIKNKGMEIVKNIYVMTGCTTFESFNNKSEAIWELVEEQTLLDKFYDLLGVENLEKFYLSDVSNDKIFMFDMGELKTTSSGEYWSKSEMIYNILRGHSKIIKLPPKPIFSDEEKEQLKFVYTLFSDCWVARDNDGSDDLWVFRRKPYMEDNYWVLKNGSSGEEMKINKDILLSIRCQDTEPFEINQQLIDSL